MGGSTALGAVGYAGCVREMAAQAKEAGIELGHVASATGSGGTTAGLVLGTALFLPDAKATGLGVDTDPFEDIVPELVKGGRRAHRPESPPPIWTAASA